MLEEAIAVVRQEFATVPDNDELIRKVSEKLCNTYENPPIKDFEFILHKPFSLSEVRTVLFAPQDDQISYYSIVLLAAVESPIGHPLKKTGSLLLTLLYLIHRKKFSILKEFVLSDGLLPIAQLLNYENLYERSQALEIFMSITDCDVYDWFNPPDSYSNRLMHEKLLSLVKVPYFINNLLLNRKESFPGGSFRALQILAFWLSWVRALYTQDQKLSLSHKLVEELHQWSITNPSSESGVMEEEVQLAKTLYDDFCKERTGLHSDDLSPSLVSGVVMPRSVNENTVQELAKLPAKEAVIEAVAVDDISTLLEKAQSLKESGNALYRNNNIDAARAKYEEAILITEELVQKYSGMNNEQIKIHTESTDNLSLSLSSLQVNLRTNLSNALWKSYSQLQVQGKENTNAHLLEEKEVLLQKIVDHSNIALSLQPTHAKACYRLLLTMLEQKKHRAAFDRAELFKQLLHSESSVSDPTNNGGALGQQLRDDIDRISRIQRRCVAVELLEYPASDKDQASTFDCNKWNMDSKRLKLLSTILKRDHLSHIVPDCLQVLPASSNVVAPSSPASAVAKKAREEIIQSDPKVDKILNYLFEQRDETVDHGIAAKVGKNDSKSKVVEKKKKAVDASAKSKPKGSSGDRKLVQQLKRMAGTFASLLLRAKSSTAEDVTIVSEKESMLRDATQHMLSLLITKELSFKDLFLTLDDNDVLFLISIITYAIQLTELQELGVKIINGLVKADRVQSLFFLFRMEYPQVCIKALSAVQELVKIRSSQLETYIKLLRE